MKKDTIYDDNQSYRYDEPMCQDEYENELYMNIPEIEKLSDSHSHLMTYIVWGDTKGWVDKSL